MFSDSLQDASQLHDKLHVLVLLKKLKKESRSLMKPAAVGKVFTEANLLFRDALQHDNMKFSSITK